MTARTEDGRRTKNGLSTNNYEPRTGSTWRITAPLLLILAVAQVCPGIHVCEA
jgi:hypothetical protein